ncbi:virulence factor MVIN family protein [Emticicia oligotrophica DSM 17448]|uniref:Virulence factor MVIN family protein n=1 Tax=Emticicia oligotrophica (strain DSM 17448 / CIP 109782 / MTCC 6937 / GPTSA100-15) TaxID=929562 RepID=A0ABN4AEM3_EMTOG|nr:lipid II flippase MurJ [Emticicia oligotrophica]AFK03205.1 virulence factor MVIN family protein [Emticicia oligotrophica DSM 17448]
MFKSSFFLSVLSLIISLLSLINQLLIAHKFGSSTDLDAYIVASSIPTFISGTITAGFSYSLVPFLLQQSKEKYDEIVVALLFFLLFGTIIIVLLGYFGSKYYLLTVYPQYNEIILLTVSKFSWIYCFCTILISFLGSIFIAIKKFYIPMILGSFPYLGIIFGVLLFDSQNSTINIASGVLLGTIGSLIINFILLRKRIVLTKLKSFNWEVVLDFFKHLPLVVVGMLCFTIYQSVDSYWASILGVSNLSYLSYCQRIIIAIGGIVIVGPSVILIPYLSETLTNKGYKAFLLILLKTIKLTIFIATFVCIILSSFSEIIIKILFQRGSFDNFSVIGVSTVLPYFAIGMIPMICVVVLFRAIMLVDNGKKVAILGLISLVMYVLFSWIFSIYWGLKGIGLAYICTWFTTLFASLRILFKTNSSLFFSHENLIDLFKYTILIGLVSIFTSFIRVYFFFEYNIILQLMLSSLLVLILYICLSFLLKIQENMLLIDKIKHQISRKF